MTLIPIYTAKLEILPILHNLKIYLNHCQLNYVILRLFQGKISAERFK